MKKHAFIITYPGEKGTKEYCGGVYVDRDNIRKHLLSPFGGFWNEDEITHCDNWSSQQLKQSFSLRKSYDYLMFYFSGHGYFDGKQTILDLPRGDEIDEDTLLAYNDKRMLILDCCRVVYPSILHEAKKVQIFKAEGHVFNAEKCRIAFEEDLLDCDNSITRYYSCSVGESSLDDSSVGGLYTSSLIESFDSIKKTSFRYKGQLPTLLCIDELSADIETVVSNQSLGEQNPRIKREKLNTQFPFAVIA